jgi:Uma2 family endonuclease
MWSTLLPLRASGRAPLLGRTRRAIVWVMRAKHARVPFTYAHYRQLPEDGKRWELLDGDFFVTPAPTTFHQTVSRRLQYALMQALEETGIALVFNAPVDVLFEDTTCLQPDIAVVRSDRKDIVSERAIEGPPDLVVEILSPSTRDRDLYIKRDAYARFGVSEYWVVDPNLGMVEVFRAEGGAAAWVQRFDRAATLTSLEFAEVAIPMASLFRAL